MREHFGAQLKDKSEEAWKAGHLRLYEHLKDVPEKHQPDTLEEMAPLFQAVHHGCQAGRRQEALDEVYFDRIVRGNEAYLFRKLGAFGVDLGLVASFFDLPFEHPASDLAERARGWLLNSAAIHLRAFGRLREALAPMDLASKMAIEERWEDAAGSLSNLSELQLTLGDIASAVACGEASVEYADRTHDTGERIFARSTLAHAKHQSGQVMEALALVNEAAGIQKQSKLHDSLLHLLRSYQYCDLLLTLGQPEAARKWARKTLELAKETHAELLAFALDQLSLGLAALALEDRDEARTQLDHAVDGLRRAGTKHHMPRGFLARAALFRETKEFAKSRRDLDEAMRIAERGGMRLFQCDAHLGYARLALAEDKPDDARPHLESTKALVSACGYGRRKGEVEELEKALA